LRDQITRFTQKDRESLYDAWDRFKEMLRLCPHHGLEKWLIVHTFYNGLLYTTKMTFDAVAGGALINKNYTATYVTTRFSLDLIFNCFNMSLFVLICD